MPITPFHFGPGALLHTVVPERISFLAFCSANVLIDLEPLYYMVTGQYPLHRFFHTYVGATIIMVATTAIFLALFQLSSKVKLFNIFNWQSLATSQIWLGAAAGSYSHIVLDSVMHPDIAPLSPFSEANNLFLIIPLRELHLFCVFSAFLGLSILGVRYFVRKRSRAIRSQNDAD